jgi:hypothetical protein
VAVLSSLEPLDALVLLEIEVYEKKRPEKIALVGRAELDKLRVFWPNMARLAQKFEAAADVALSLENLARLGLVYDCAKWVSTDAGFHIPVPITDEQATIDLTNTARALLSACRR